MTLMLANLLTQEFIYQTKMDLTQHKALVLIAALAIIAFLVIYAPWSYYVSKNKNLHYHSAFSISGLTFIAFSSLSIASIYPLFLTPGDLQSKGMLFESYLFAALTIILLAGAAGKFLRDTNNLSEFSKEYSELRSSPEGPAALSHLEGIGQRFVLKYGFIMFVLLGISWYLVSTLVCAWVAIGSLHALADSANATTLLNLTEPISRKTESFIEVTAAILDRPTSDKAPAFLLLGLSSIPLFPPVFIIAVNTSYIVRSALLKHTTYTRIKDDNYHFVRDIVQSLCGSQLCPEILIARRHQAELSVVYGGLLRPRHSIIIDASTLRRSMSKPEISALCAHEMGHAISRHCIKRRRYQLLVRLIGLGDSSVCLFENPMKIEYQADKLAVYRFGTDPSILAAALEKYFGLYSYFSNHPRGLAASSHKAPPLFANWPWPVRGILTWHHLYFHGCEYGFWHPSVEDRCRRLRAYTP